MQSALRCLGTALAAAACAWGAASPAAAELGKGRESVETDRASLSASMTSAASSSYTVYTLTLPNSTRVREFVGADGTVFAVSWRGPGRPDLRRLLGAGFDRMQASHTRAAPRARRPIGMGARDLVIHTGGHPGVFWGAAYLPVRTPADFSAAAFR